MCEEVIKVEENGPKGKGLDHIDLQVKQHANKQGTIQQLCVTSLVYGVVLPDPILLLPFDSGEEFKKTIQEQNQQEQK